MDLETKYEIEREKWDRLARRNLGPEDLLPPGTTFRERVEADDNMSFVTDDVQDFLGRLEGKRLLELGCGSGGYAVLLARGGALVSAVDLSPGSIEATRARAELNGVELDATLAPAEELPYPDDSFDIAFGTSSLHHLEVDRAGPELWRVLKPGGKAFFLEPMGMNPLLRLARDRLPYPYKTPRGTDRPLTYDDIHAWGSGFSSYWFKEAQLFSMIERVFGFHHRLPRLRRFDEAVLRRFPATRRWARHVAFFGINYQDGSFRSNKPKPPRPSDRGSGRMSEGR
jgi:SAM-dependent methyltransferase